MCCHWQKGQAARTTQSADYNLKRQSLVLLPGSPASLTADAIPCSAPAACDKT